MNIQQKQHFLVNAAYWALIAGGIYLAFEYLLPVSVPFILGILVAYWVVRISRRLHCCNRVFRVGLILLV